MGTEIWCLIVVIGLQYWALERDRRFYNRQIQLLLDKLMSRSYAEYQRASTEPVRPAVQAVRDEPDDLRTLREFTANLQ